MSTTTNPQQRQEPAQQPAQAAPAQQPGQNPASPPTEPQTATDTARADVDDAQAAVERTPSAGSDDVAALRRESASYRRRLREAERQRDALQERVDRLDREEVERRAGERHQFQQASDVWLATSVDAMRGEDGLLSDDRVGQELARVMQEHPHWLKPGPDFHQGPRLSPEPQGPSFGQALKGRR